MGKHPLHVTQPAIETAEDFAPARQAFGRRQALRFGLAGGLLLAGCASAGAQDAPAQSPRDRLRERLQARRAQGGQAQPQGPAGPPVEHPLAKPGRYQVSQVEGVWRDGARGDRAVPWRAYLPEGLSGALPAMLYSHGGGGTRASGQLYGQHLASHGVAALHLQHAGSDRDAFRADPRGISEAARDPKAGKPRFEDVGFAWRTLSTEAAGALRGRIDPARCGIAGHSFGAITTQIIAGQDVTGFGRSLALEQLKAAFSLSPSPPRAGYGSAETAFRAMAMPIFHATGTADDAPNGDFKAIARRIPFDRITNVDQHLMILEGANHFTFGGDPNPELFGRSFSYPNLGRHHDLLKATMAAFFSWRLAGDQSGAAFLNDGAFAALLEANDVYERKTAS